MTLTPQERMKIPRHPLPAQPPELRVQCFAEVALGYDEQTAREEAMRCLQCKRPYCVDGCPVAIDIPGFLKEIVAGNIDVAAAIIKKTNSLPSICGRVCPQETQCEERCVLAKKGQPVAIGALERFVADYDRRYRLTKPEVTVKASGKKIAVVGSGPAGLTAAGTLAQMGHAVTIFEALHEPGGVLVYGIPEFRLPKEIVREEVSSLLDLGVEFNLNVLVGRTLTIDELFAAGYSAVFLAPGAGVPQFMGIPGENLNGVSSANEFLTRVNLMKAFLFPEYDTPVYCGKHVAVIGGGNTAMDAARTAKRLGPEKVYIVYRRSEKEMPARREEIEHAKEEGIEFMCLTAPVAYHSNSRGWVEEMECIRMELSEPDESGRRRPVPVPNSNFRVPVDTVIVAIGAKTNDLIVKTTGGLTVAKKGYLLVDPETQMTTRPGIFAGGDIAGGEATVIAAMGQGRVAAHSIHRYVLERG
ncbi:MAG: NADPH-dependent glutamate synthase [Candidatus Sumerlaeaceae bacterium]|nr:NADPH-dependent glutamate synthase [Candidatus Sumerlaeaceae bacterium]